MIFELLHGKLLFSFVVYMVQRSDKCGFCFVLFHQILPVASASQLILVDLICALNTLKTDTILHLVKEVVKKPSQIKGEEVTRKIILLS